MTSPEHPIREYAPGITDPNEFSALVESHWLFTQNDLDSYSRDVLGSRIGWLQQALTYGAGSCEGTDLQFMTDVEILTEYAVLEELRTRADLNLATD